MPGDEDKPGAGSRGTVYQPPPSNAGAASIPPPASTSRYGSVPPPGTTAYSPPPSGRLPVGVVLNHIYEVRRFIDRGGMGEVYEGINVNTDERVAIKVILPHLAEDPNVQAMFRKEARTLTRLNHPALVQYRVLAQEPQLGALYIVTEFVDGIGLDQMIGQVTPGEEQLRGLLRRLAEGLKAAHELGAIHRDISPDNILAPGGRLEAAKIIDFGIAKDLQTSQGTIVGAGFAGKLGYVAPEQFGDFGREIGPWTDVYSLGLVMLALLSGQAPDMGTTLVEAVDRRRAGPDLSPVPPGLTPVLSAMLQADPQKRLRSMDEVLAALDKPVRKTRAAKPATAPAAAGPATAASKKVSAPPKAQSALKLAPAAPAKADAGLPKSALIWAGAAGGAVLLIGLAVVLFSGGKKDAGAGAGGTLASLSQPASGLARTVETAIGASRCAWLEYGPLSEGDGGRIALSLTGGAGDPDAAAGSVKTAVEHAGKAVDLRQGAVVAFNSVACGAVDAMKTVRASASNGDSWLSAPATLLRPDAHAECRSDPAYALAVIEGAVGPDDAALALVQPDGQVRAVFNGKAGLAALQGRPGFVGAARATGDGGFRVSLCHRQPGVYGVALIRGKGPFDLGLPTIDQADAGPTPANFADRFEAAARSHGWRTQMAWYEVAPAAPGAAAPAPAAAPA
ncbi:MAG TPA: serine/threonine-protein kinase, partial [Caulobacteraceae bacterium]|nr:serine/threonine-protein kinase [Caulobacteraceae bacterium]